MLVINLFGGPGIGKSTTAAAVFSSLKNKGVNVELVTEAAKDFTWSGDKVSLSNALFVSANQDIRLHRLRGQVDVVVTDSPLPLGALYAKPPYNGPGYRKMLREVWGSYDNISFILKRHKPYSPVGRNQTYEQAVALDDLIADLLPTHDPRVYHLLGDEKAYLKILDILELEYDL
jgi:hypothetical protein